jgi:hypothetical protein
MASPLLVNEEVRRFMRRKLMCDVDIFGLLRQCVRAGQACRGHAVTMLKISEVAQTQTQLHCKSSTLSVCCRRDNSV